ncbi:MULTISPECIES: hypothetical protein [Protofrankia]|uniref:hypothetical protein n=1 Tax=Protofrankia TaxID=2994361 RepID=UPI000A3DDF29|nr:MULTISPECIES: hypothetical protein [Protofrankia]
MAESLPHVAIVRRPNIEKNTVETCLERVRQKYRGKGCLIKSPSDYVRRVKENPIRGDLPWTTTAAPARDVVTHADRLAR